VPTLSFHHFVTSGSLLSSTSVFPSRVSGGLITTADSNNPASSRYFLYLMAEILLSQASCASPSSIFFEVRGDIECDQTDAIICTINLTFTGIFTLKVGFLRFA
jgi:hypothetical protein